MHKEPDKELKVLTSKLPTSQSDLICGTCLILCRSPKCQGMETGPLGVPCGFWHESCGSCVLQGGASMSQRIPQMREEESHTRFQLLADRNHL